MRSLRRWLLVALGVASILAGWWAWRSQQDQGVTSFYHNELAASMHPTLEVGEKRPIGGPGRAPARLPVDAPAAAAIFAVAGLALALQQRSRSKRS
jgi:hypothetical protein